MNIRVTFGGGKKVDAQVRNHVVRTDQSVQHGGEGAAPEPFDLFLASLAASAGARVLAFCQARNISTEDIEILQRHRFDELSKRLSCVELELVLPFEFPEGERAALIRAAESSDVKEVLASAPDVVVSLRVPEMIS